MQESKESGPHITTREELDALYKNVKELLPENDRPDQEKIDIFGKIYDMMKEQGKNEIVDGKLPYSVFLQEDDVNKRLQIDDSLYTLYPSGDFQIKEKGIIYSNTKNTETGEYVVQNYVGATVIQKYRAVLDVVYAFLAPKKLDMTPQDSIPQETLPKFVPPK